MSDLRFSRTGKTNPFGKCTEELKTVVPEEVKDAVIGLSFASGVTPAEYLRNLVTAHVFGHAHVLRLQHRAMNGTAGIGREEGE